MKKASISIVITLLILFVIQIPFNIHNNAYYYATHMPHKENQYPFMELLHTNHLPAGYLPNYRVENHDKRDVHWTIIRKEKIRTNSDIIETLNNSILYGKDYQKDYTNNCAVLSFSNSGTIDIYYTSGNFPKNAKPVLYHSLKEIQKEIKQHSDKPLINIQWIWNGWFKLTKHD